MMYFQFVPSLQPLKGTEAIVHAFRRVVFRLVRIVVRSNSAQRRVSGENVSKLQVLSASAVQPLDKNGFIPLYFQIQRALMEKIHSGELSEGDSLASEEELARMYRVSRMTARQALHGLKE